MGTNNITLKVDKSLLGVKGNKMNFDFKWADNSTVNGNILQFMDLGDTAPNDRFNYRVTTEGAKKNAAAVDVNLILIIVLIVMVVSAFVVIIYILNDKKRKKGMDRRNEK
jgi:hypothetical protein